MAANWNPTELDANLGFYIRNYSDKLPQALLTQVGANNSVYRLIYADNIRMYGMSISKNVLGVSVSAETSYRHNTPLNTTILGISPRSEEHTSELQSLMRISYAVFCFKKKKYNI